MFNIEGVSHQPCRMWLFSCDERCHVLVTSCCYNQHPTGSLEGEVYFDLNREAVFDDREGMAAGSWTELTARLPICKCKCGHQRRTSDIQLPVLVQEVLEIGYLTEHRVRLVTGMPQWSSHLCPPLFCSYWCATKPSFLCGCQGFELRPSCWGSKHAYPLSHFPIPNF